jgi:tol-pal system protein YbgF
LRQRVEQLEEQLVDLQVMIGTLESLARPGAANAAGARGPVSGDLGASDQARLESMETQIRALSSQIEQLSGEVRAQVAQPRRSDAGGAPFQDPTVPHAGATAQSGPSRFGSTTVTSGSDDPIGGLMSEGAKGATNHSEVNGGAQPPAPGALAAADPAASADGGNPKQAYENAYGYLLQQDYGGAQAGFGDFLKRYPKDPLAPNALYWLGETHYVQKNYTDAAEAFDLVLSSYGTSAKAPDAQLKRAMALAQLGKKQDACAALRQLGAKFPNAPPHVKAKAESERQRAGCS